MKDFPYKTALITGASSGIGKALAYELAQKKVNLIITARSEDKLAQIANDIIKKFGVQVLVIKADLSQPDASQFLFDKVKEQQFEVDLLINNAGIGKWTNFMDETLESYDHMLQLNVNSLVKLTHLFLPNMLKNKRGGIINIASTGALQPCPYIAVYCASKSFVLNFSESLLGEFEDQGIAVTAICPGNTLTNFQQTARANTKGMKFETPENVAKQSIAALLKKRSNHIVGLDNKLQALIPRLFPRKTVIRIVKNMMNKKVNGTK